MWHRVKVKTKPVDHPIALADLKQRIRVDFDDDDSVISSYLRGAVSRIDGPNGIGYAMMEQSWEYSVDGLSGAFYLLGAPVKSVTSIKYYDADGVEQTLDAAEYRVDVGGDRARVEPVNDWPSTDGRLGAFTIEYVLGEADAADVPADLVDAICLMVAHRYEMRQPTAYGQVSSVPFSYDSIVAEYNRLAVA